MGANGATVAWYAKRRRIVAIRVAPIFGSSIGPA